MVAFGQLYPRDSTGANLGCSVVSTKGTEHKMSQECKDELGSSIAGAREVSACGDDARDVHGRAMPDECEKHAGAGVHLISIHPLVHSNPNTRWQRASIC